MSEHDPSLGFPSPLVEVEVKLKGNDFDMSARVSVPRGPMRRAELLPLARSLSDSVVARVEKKLADEGKQISCKPGCGACCRQMVPLAEVEARFFATYVKVLPEPRRSQVLARFAEAVRRLEESGLAARLRDRTRWHAEEFKQLGVDYFRQGIACPFLENESCSIYLDRPIVCREHLVLSPPEFCSPDPKGTVEKVRIPLPVMRGLARFDPVPPGTDFIRWVPLTLALEWAEANPDEPPPLPGPDWLRQFFQNLGRRPAPDGSDEDGSLPV